MPIIRVEILSGRSSAQKQELADALTRETARIAGCEPGDVQILIRDIDASNWAIGGSMIGSPTLYGD